MFIDAPYADAARPLATEYSKSVDVILTFKALRQKCCQCQLDATDDEPDRTQVGSTARERLTVLSKRLSIPLKAAVRLANSHCDRQD